MFSQQEIARVQATVVVKRAAGTPTEELCPFKREGNAHIRTCRRYCKRIYPRLYKECIPIIGKRMSCCPCTGKNAPYIKSKFRKIFMEEDNESTK